MHAAHPRYRRIYRFTLTNNDKHVTDERRGGDFIFFSTRSGFGWNGSRESRENPRASEWVRFRFRFLSSADKKGKRKKKEKRNIPFFHRRLLLRDLFRGFDILWRRSTRCAVFRVACAPWTIRNEVERIVNEYWIEIGRFIFLLFENENSSYFFVYIFFVFIREYMGNGTESETFLMLVSFLISILFPQIEYHPSCLFQLGRISKNIYKNNI